MATSRNGVEYTHSIYIQDIKLIEEWGASKPNSITIGGKSHKFRVTGNPGVWYINNPLDVKIGDDIFMDGDNKPRYRIVDIGEYEPQPTLRTLYMVIP